MLFKNFNLVFTTVAEERTEELKKIIDLMDDLCGAFTPILQLTPYMPQKGEYMEIANSTGKPEVIEIISKHLQPLLMLVLSLIRSVV